MSSSAPADHSNSQSVESPASGDRPALKSQRCRVCNLWFTPVRPLQACCCGSCAITYSRLSGEKRQSVAMKRVAMAERREKREALKTRREWLADAQAAFNAWIRERDFGQPCISCGRNTGAKRNAGHYLSVGSHPELRFEPLNCHSQCEHCNSWKSGNAIDYRIRLIQKIGAAQVEWLEGPHEPKKYTVDQLKAMARNWRAMKRQLQKARGA
jgi:hypothetical protein